MLPGGVSTASIIRDASHCKIQSTARLWEFLKRKPEDLLLKEASLVVDEGTKGQKAGHLQHRRIT